MTETTTQPTVTLPVYGGTTRTFLLGSMTPEQAATFVAIPGPGEWYAVHADAVLKDGRPSAFTLLLGDTAGRLRLVTVAPDGTRTK